MESDRKSSDFGIWWLAFGYFACYAPYTLLTKSATKGLLPGQPKALDGFSVLPISVLASLIGMIVFISVKGWWKYATHRQVFGLSLPMPTKWTAFSGVCTATIIMTTTLAYTFTGVSIVFIMLLMRGGVLMIAPVADLAAKRKVHWYSWVALFLSLLAVVVADRGGEVKITLLCAVNVAAYLAAYFVRLRFMSRLAKSEDENANTRYFVEEQMVGSPLLVIALTVVAIGGWGNIGHQLRYGFVSMWGNQAVWAVLTLGVLSQGTGIFGGLILLDKRENTFCVPVNRTSSILAGVVASYAIALLFKQRFPTKFEVAGASLVVLAIAFLSIPAILKKRRAALSAASTTSTEPAGAR